MAEKTVSKHLINLEKYFSPSNPILQTASQSFHQLDQLEYDLGLIDDDETTATKSSWWPIVSLIGGFSTSKSDFINRYLDSNLHSSLHKFTVHQYTPQETNATLPGTALDADHRLPFYQISQKINSIESDTDNNDNQINAFLELKTVNSSRLKGKLFIDTPVLNSTKDPIIQSVLTQHVLDMSDLVLVFTDLFEATPDLIEESVKEIVTQQDTNKFIFVVDHSEITLDTKKSNEIIMSWQRRLAELGIHTGQFIVLSESENASLLEIDQRLANIENDRSYRVINSLEKSIQDINDCYIPEVEEQLLIWKDRINMSTLIILGFIVTLLLFAEISMGVVQIIFDPIIGPIFLLILIAFLIPMHLMVAKVHAKFIIKNLNKRQKKLNLTENLAGLFEKSLTFWRIILPINETVAKSKKTRIKIHMLTEQCKDMVQELNDQFSNYHIPDDLQDSTSEQTNFTQNL